jgi:hypothetical protein
VNSTRRTQIKKIRIRHFSDTKSCSGTLLCSFLYRDTVLLPFCCRFVAVHFRHRVTLPRFFDDFSAMQRFSMVCRPGPFPVIVNFCPYTVLVSFSAAVST